MFVLSHQGDSVGTTRLESGDPSIHSVSGVFENMGGVKALAKWIESIGGEEDNGVIYINLNEDFILSGAMGKSVEYIEATLIAVPADDEAYLDVSLTPENFQAYFPDHLAADSSSNDE